MTLKLRALTLPLTLIVSLNGLLACTSKKPKVLRQIGNYMITDRDAELRDRVIRVYYPEERREGLGLQQLTESFTRAAVLSRNGYDLGDGAIRREEARIQAATQAPDTLEKIQKVFGNDRDAYRKVFILPALADRVIEFEFFNRRPDLQATHRRNAEDFLQEALLSPLGFDRLATSRGAKVATVKLSRTRGFEGERPRPEAMRVSEEELKEAARWLDEYVAPLIAEKRFPRTVVPQVIEQPLEFVVARLDRTRPVVQLRVASFAKTTFAEWYRKESALIPFR